MSDRAVFVRVEGRVQNVGFRAFTHEQARELGVSGWVVNRPDGSVEAALVGPGTALATMIERLRKGPPSADVTSVDVRSSDQGQAAEPPPGGYRF